MFQCVPFMAVVCWKRKKQKSWQKKKRNQRKAWINRNLNGSLGFLNERSCFRSLAPCVCELPFVFLHLKNKKRRRRWSAYKSLHYSKRRKNTVHSSCRLLFLHAFVQKKRRACVAASKRKDLESGLLIFIILNASQPYTTKKPAINTCNMTNIQAFSL